MCLDVTNLELRSNFHILLVFENGEKRLFDMRPLLNMQPWQALADTRKFSEATVAYGTVTWPGNLDIAPETLYDCSVPVDA